MKFNTRQILRRTGLLSHQLLATERVSSLSRAYKPIVYGYSIEDWSPNPVLFLSPFRQYSRLLCVEGVLLLRPSAL